MQNQVNQAQGATKCMVESNLEGDKDTIDSSSTLCMCSDPVTNNRSSSLNHFCLGNQTDIDVDAPTK